MCGNGGESDRKGGDRGEEAHDEDDGSQSIEIRIKKGPDGERNANGKKRESQSQKAEAGAHGLVDVLREKAPVPW